mmetsp:Transcript_72383/g.143734  ORF Transcript_72383/g.143734 Transcript_72383/m.143734 type:complete len:184 (-) Transcript_72383:541-1092(-)
MVSALVRMAKNSMPLPDFFFELCVFIDGYSVAGGVPGGLLAEFVMSEIGRSVTHELSPYFGARATKAITSFGLFMVMGTYMEFFAQIAYAYAHQCGEGEQPGITEGAPGMGEAPSSAPAAAQPRHAPLAAVVRALPDFSHCLPEDYRKGYGDWRSGKSRGAKGELANAAAGSADDRWANKKEL